MCFLLSSVVLIKLITSVGKYLCGTKHFYVQTANELIKGFMSGCNQWHCRQLFLHCSQDLWGSQPTVSKYFSLIWWPVLERREAGVPMHVSCWKYGIREAVMHLKPEPRMNGKRLRKRME